MCTLLHRACCHVDFAWDIWLVPIHIVTSPQLVGWWLASSISHTHDDVIKWKHFPRYWSFARGIHPSPVNFPPHKNQWRGAFNAFFDLRLNNDWVNNREAGDLRRHLGHYDVTVIQLSHRHTNCSDVIWMTWYQIIVRKMAARLHAPMGTVSPHAIRMVLP